MLCEACERLKWKEPTKIQQEAIPLALEGIKHVATAARRARTCLSMFAWVCPLAGVVPENSFLFELMVEARQGNIQLYHCML